MQKHRSLLLMNNFVIYGGTFDPIHFGHIKTALDVQNTFHFDRFVFLPCKKPVLKEPSQASSEQRISMLKLGLLPYPEFTIDLREMNRNTPSYMVETLESYREELGKAVSITLLLGTDAFLDLPRWHHWEKILKLCHILVINRPGTEDKKPSNTLLNLLKKHETNHHRDLLKRPYGKIYQYDAGRYDISSTEIREKINERKSIKDYIPPAVYQYIVDEKLYGIKD